MSDKRKNETSDKTLSTKKNLSEAPKSKTSKSTLASEDEVVFYDSPKDHSSSIPSYEKSGQTFLANKNKGGSKLALRICAVVLGVIMIISGSGCIVMYNYFSRVNYESYESSQNNNENSKNSSGNTNTSKNTNSYDGTLLTDSDILNILIIGADTRYNQDRGNSDTMILLSIDTRHKKLKLLSFMRDTYVAIPGYDENKLTAAFNLGGAALTVNTIQSNYGIQIDRYAIVDFASFKNIIDTLGGIDIELTQEEVDYIDWQCWKNHQVETRNELDASSYTYTPNADGENVAMVHLNGRQALWHSRNRGEEGICSGDDYTRTQRQRNVISLLVNRLKNSDFSTAMSIIYEIGPLITTNLKTSEITTLATNITKYLNYDIVSTSAPEYDKIGVDFYYSDDDHPIYIGGWPQSCIVIIDWDDFRVKTANFVFGDGNTE